jgi:Lar family restriction alleviation protein
MTDTSLPELEPCPFCGGEALFASKYAPTDTREQVACAHCYATAMWANDRGKAAGFWNTRTQASGANAALDELRGKFRMVISHASGGHLSEPGDIDRHTNDICVEISRHHNRVWEHAQETARKEGANAALIEAFTHTAASLAAAISLLKRGGKAAKKAAPSDKMFDQMVRDYEASLDRARAALTLARDNQA